jgi:hypothetical protein
VFSAPEALPTLAELEDPAGWLARTAADNGRGRAQRSSA